MIPLGVRHYRRIAEIADREAGLHMPEAKQDFVASRLQKRLRAHGLSDFETYVALLESASPDGNRELQSLISALTTNVTEAFREAHHFTFFVRHLSATLGLSLPGSHAASAAKPVRSAGRYLVWSAGCSTGEEPLSLAAVCHAILGPHWPRHVRILATDVDVAALDIARNRAEDMALAARLRKLPEGIDRSGLREPCEDGVWMQSLYAGITVMHHNLLRDLELPGRFDAIFCRNVTIYFSRETQDLVHGLLLKRLAPGGLLALGHSERFSAPGSGLLCVGRTAFQSPSTLSAEAGGAASCH